MKLVVGRELERADQPAGTVLVRRPGFGKIVLSRDKIGRARLVLYTCELVAGISQLA